MDFLRQTQSVALCGQRITESVFQSPRYVGLHHLQDRPSEVRADQSPCSQMFPVTKAGVVFCP